MLGLKKTLDRQVITMTFATYATIGMGCAVDSKATINHMIPHPNGELAGMSTQELYKRLAAEKHHNSKGCGKPTHVDGTNGGLMPCGALLTRFGKTEPYYCAKCDPAVGE